MLCSLLIYWPSNWALTSLCTAATEQCVGQSVWSSFWQNRLKLLSWPKDQTVVVLGGFQLWMCAAVSVWSRAFTEKSILGSVNLLYPVKQSKEKNRQNKKTAANPVWMLTIKGIPCCFCRYCGDNMLTIKQDCKQLCCRCSSNGWRDAHTGMA